MQSFQITAGQAGQRLDKFLRRMLPNAGSGFLYKMLRKKNIVLNHGKAEGKEILTVGDTVDFYLPYTVRGGYRRRYGGIPACLSGHPGRGNSLSGRKRSDRQ